MKKSSGIIWPYAVSIAIILVFGACVATVVITNTLPVEDSDTYMRGYHEADAAANEIIEARIAFDKEYTVDYINEGLNLDNSTIKYKVTDKQNNPINDAKVKIVITRPNNHKHDQILESFEVSDGIYSFESIKIPIEGRWDIMAKVNVGKLERYLNIKADTRKDEIVEY
ncbi:MAG: FixH family protein [Sulfurimonas sp.]|uniref:FixH family protein n=1 Tax=Sulfurimonas sp. TaxID=2022749 RepID=UPI0025F2EF29|nr:FixH family protein [Sulfurimonas sp.]MCK9492149.1 FixH family protein [Sulfurimonas sp.]